MPPDRPRRRRADLGGVVGARGDLHTRVTQDATDRLDPEPVARISFARRSSRTSRSRSAIRCASAVVVPGAMPSSTSACRTQVRNASGRIPSWSAIRLIAPTLDSGSRRASNAIRIARSFSSSLYFRGAAMTPILHRFESLHRTRGASTPPRATRMARALQLPSTTAHSEADHPSAAPPTQLSPTSLDKTTRGEEFQRARPQTRQTVTSTA